MLGNPRHGPTRRQGSGDGRLPVVVSNTEGTGPLTDIVQIAAGVDHSCAVGSNGEVRCWGDRANVGDGGSAYRSRPVVVRYVDGSPLVGVLQIDADEVTCAALDNGQARCWGTRPSTVLGSDGSSPLTGVVQVDTGYGHSCALVTDGRAQCWGYNRYGQIGDGTTSDRLLPTSVLDPAPARPLTDVAGVSAGRYDTCTRLTLGQARCWGGGFNGLIGNDTTTVEARTRPAPVLQYRA